MLYSLARFPKRRVAEWYLRTPPGDFYKRNTHRSLGHIMDVAEEIKEALESGKPIVSLETALITHGIPAPMNVETARSLERIVRKTGAIPATIGLIGGRVKVGLSDDELERLGNVHGKTNSVKVSRRDLSAAIAMKYDGGTTVSGTMVISHLAGIKIFATGGLGGVHRGGEHTMDVSCDLTELGRTPVAVVTAGVKSILDIKRSLEYLETQGVPVLTYGPTHDFPAFFHPLSGYKAPWRAGEAKEAARVIYNGHLLGMKNGTLFCAPIPENYAEIGRSIQNAVDQAVAESEANGVNLSGKGATPWLLQRVYELTDGKSLTNNIALLENTALIGGHIAVEYSNLVHGPAASAGIQPLLPPISAKMSPARLVVIGAAAIDITSKANSDSPLGHSSTVPGTVVSTLGGVARNVAEATHRILDHHSKSELSVLLISSVGNDSFGRHLISETKALGMRTDGFVQTSSSNESKAVATAVCNMVLDSQGDLAGGIADMSGIQMVTAPEIINHVRQHKPQMVLFDGNLSPSAMAGIVTECFNSNITTFFEPTSVVKSSRILPALDGTFSRVPIFSSPVQYASPNILELHHLFESARISGLMNSDRWWQVIDNLGIGQEFQLHIAQLSKIPVSETTVSGDLSFLINDGIAQMALHMLPFFQHLIVKCGERGVLVVFQVTENNLPSSKWRQERTNLQQRQIISHTETVTVVLKHFPPPPIPPEEIVNVTGAGDSLVGAILARLVETENGFYDPISLTNIIQLGQQAALLSLKSQFAVSPELGKV